MAFSGQALARGMANRCARCGTGGIFRSYYRLHPTCRSCGMRFERESGEWTGALMIIIAVTEILFAVWFGLGMWVTWPDVPWTLLLVGGIALNLIVPVLFYPWSQSVWIGLHYSFVPLDAAEEADAIAALGADALGADAPGADAPGADALGDAAADAERGPQGADGPRR